MFVLIVSLFSVLSSLFSLFSSRRVIVICHVFAKQDVSKLVAGRIISFAVLSFLGQNHYRSKNWPKQRLYSGCCHVREGLRRRRRISVQIMGARGKYQLWQRRAALTRNRGITSTAISGAPEEHRHQTGFRHVTRRMCALCCH